MKSTCLKVLFAFFGLFELSSKHFFLVSGQPQGGDEGGESSQGGDEGGEVSEGGEGQSENDYELDIDCNYIFGVGISATTTDVCIGHSLASGTSSYKYSCNDDGDAIRKYSYTTADCSGVATLEDTYTKADSDVKFQCKSNDCSIRVKIYNVTSTDNCDIVSEYYRSEAYVESVCTWISDDSEQYTCVNNTVMKRHWKDDQTCDGTESQRYNLGKGCNYIEEEADSFYSYSEIIECNSAPIAPDVYITNAANSILNFNMYYAVPAIAVGFALSTLNL